MQHLVSIDDLTESDIDILFYRVEDIKNNPHRLKYHLHDKILANLFYEPSTRTSSSFAAAMYKLGGNVISINDVNYSSVSKGENLEDTIKTMGLYADMRAKYGAGQVNHTCRHGSARNPLDALGRDSYSANR